MVSEGQVRTGQAETSKVRTGQVRTGQVWTGHIWKVQVGTGQVVQCPPHPHPNCSPNQKQFKLGQVKYVKSTGRVKFGWERLFFQCCAVYPSFSKHTIFLCGVLPNIVLCLCLSTLILGLSWNINLTQLVSPSGALLAELVSSITDSILVGFREQQQQDNKNKNNHNFNDTWFWPYFKVRFLGQTIMTTTTTRLKSKVFSLERIYPSSPVEMSKS